MMARRLSFWCLTLSACAAWGQSWHFVQKHDLGQTITSVDAGSLGKVYVSTARGNVYSFQADGTPDTQFSSAVFQPVTSLDADNSLRVFVFYQSVGVFEFLDRFSAFPRSYALADFGLSGATLATIGLNNTIWCLMDRELIQLNPLNNSILQRIALPEVLLEQSVKKMDFKKETLLLTDAGIYSLERKDFVATHAFRSMDVVDNEIIALADKGIWSKQLTTGRESWIELPDAGFDWCVRNQGYYHFGRGTEVWIYQWK